jgi:single-stranded-DNA-specific exonuclease
MISVSGKNWEETFVSKRLLEKFKIDHKLSAIISNIAISRNFSINEIYSINNKVEVSNPFLNNKDFTISNGILKKHIDLKSKILVIGDYDVDGCVSTSLMINFLNTNKSKSTYYIPDRFKDGYGVSRNLIIKLVKKENPNLVIMLDCGSNSNDSIKYLNNLDIDTIIIDHHNINKPYPESTSLINPKKECDYINYNYLCTAFLTYLFLLFFIKINKSKISIKDSLIYVLLATVADVMPLREINRFLALDVLNNFDLNKNLILKKFFEIHKIKKKVDIDDLGFFIGPIFNSAGRMSTANMVVELLTTPKDDTKKKIIEKLYLLNSQRKKIEQKTLNRLNLGELNIRNEIIFVYDPYIPEGIIGIIASRIKEYFNKPCIVLTLSKNIIKGSARSTLNFNIGEHINESLKKNLLLSGGGHNLAAGISLEKKNIDIFKSYINRVYKKNVTLKKNEYISKLSLNTINKNLFFEINKLGPFGNLNPKPLFLIENIQILKPTILKEKFVSCFIRSKNGKLIKAISFNPINSDISLVLMNYKNEVNLIVKINENNWNNRNSIQLEIKDIIIQSNNT